MEFSTFTDQFSFFKKKMPQETKGVTPEQFYSVIVEQSEQRKDPFAYRQALLEEEWIDNRRPYYNVWPAIFPMMNRLKLDIPCSTVGTEHSSLLLKMPKGKDNPLVFDGGVISTVMFGIQEVAKQQGSDELIPGFAIMLDTGEEGEIGDKIYTFKFFPLRDDMTIDEAANILPFHESWKKGLQVPNEIINQVVKLCCCVCLIGNDPEMVTPDILAKDRQKFDNASDEQKKKLIEKAKNRGKNGAHLGMFTEQSPHYRRPHMALVWTGKGRTTAKIVMRKGAVVHRKKITDVPTGSDDE